MMGYWLVDQTVVDLTLSPMRSCMGCSQRWTTTLGSPQRGEPWEVRMRTTGASDWDIGGGMDGVSVRWMTSERCEIGVLAARRGPQTEPCREVAMEAVCAIRSNASDRAR